VFIVLQDSFVVRTFSPICSPMPLVSELPLKLARKCLDVFGLSWFDPEKKIHSISMYHTYRAVCVCVSILFVCVIYVHTYILTSLLCQLWGPG